MILVDAGPLIALLDASDRHHARIRATLETIREPLGTVWPVLTEASYILRESAPAQDALFEMVARGVPRILSLDGDDVPRIRELMAKYRDLPMDLADAALVRVAEREGVRRVLTVDRRDFSIYRAKRLGRLKLLP
jgi:predicted nucleic acid-binding protein